MADGDDVVARFKTTSMLCISFSASGIFVSSGRVELHFMYRSALLCFSIKLISWVQARLE